MTNDENSKEAIGILANCLISVGQATGMNDRFTRDVWRAAELCGVSKVDLLRLLSTSNEPEPTK